MADRFAGMEVFVKAVDHGSFTAAASALGLSPQMVGKHVALLEKRLGTELLRRTTRTQSLTAVGQAFYERCKGILAETEAAEALAHDLAATPRGRLRINAPVTFGAVCLAPIIAAFLRDFPQVEVELILDDRYVDLVDEGYDALLRFGPLKDSTLIARRLAPLRLIACAAPAYLEAHGMPATPEDLTQHECLGFVYTTGLPLTQWRFMRNGRAHEIDVSCRFRTNDSRVLGAAALAGHGILLQAEHVVRNDLAAGRLVRVLADYDAPMREMHLVFSPSRYQAPKLRTFVERVVAAFG